MQRLFPRPLGLFLAAGALLVPGISGRAPAQTQPSRTLTLADSGVRLQMGERVTLPFAAVSRIIVEDDEIARAFFQNGQAVLEGVHRGTTTVEIYQSDGTPKLLSIQVGNGGEAARPKTPNLLPNGAPAAQVSGVPASGVPASGVPASGVPASGAATSATETSAMETSATETSGVAVAAVPDMSAAGGGETPRTAAIVPSQSQLMVTLRAAPVVGTGQAQFTIDYSNPGTGVARDAIVRYALDDRVSYITGSASGGGVYDAARREVRWNLGAIEPGATGALTLRVEPVEGGRSLSFDSVATIEDGAAGPVTSATLLYSTAVTPLLTIFALPDRFLASENKPTLTDVRGNEYQTAVDRLSRMGILQGYPDGQYHPVEPTRRAEYAVMTLRGLNLRDLRDVTQIKFVLGRASTVNLSISDDAGHMVANLTRNTALEAGEHTVVWDGRTDSGQFAAPGRYAYSCEARDARGETTTLKSYINIVSPSPLRAEGVPSFVDIKPTDWYAGYLALGENQGLLRGFPDQTFRPRLPISRVEAAAIVVRALGLSQAAKEWNDKNVGFEDYDKIPDWGRGAVNAATMLTKTSTGQPILRGTAENTFDPLSDLRRDQAALIVQRIIDRETTRRVSVSGAITPGAIVSINSKPIEADAQGRFGFSFDLNTAVPTTVAVVDARQR